MMWECTLPLMGGSAMNGNECLITGLDAGSYSDGAVVVEETDGDNCNDIETSIASGTVVMKDYAFESLTLSCTDSNNDGLLDFDVGIHSMECAKGEV